VHTYDVCVRVIQLKPRGSILLAAFMPRTVGPGDAEDATAYLSKIFLGKIEAKFGQN